MRFLPSMPVGDQAVTITLASLVPGTFAEIVKYT